MDDMAPTRNYASRNRGRVFDHVELRHQRLDALKTQAQMAVDLGVTVRAYQRWESGVGQPSLEHIRDLADLFDCRTDTFFSRAPIGPEKDDDGAPLPTAA